jgi:UDP-N-acetylglucosamine--N-acetylmuramyl-(pentapeptide) pyrophosphoryl-undecaprenol N-acetylglucosamine transferase
MLEQNVVPSRATRWLAPSVTAVCAGFEETRADLPSSAPLIVTGNPARPSFEQMYRQRETWMHGYCRLQNSQESPIVSLPCDANEKRLVVIGGAFGARTINENMPHALARLREQLDGWQIVHQSGEGQLQETERRYRDAGVEALVVAYIDEMAPVMLRGGRSSNDHRRNRFGPLSRR